MTVPYTKEYPKPDDAESLCLLHDILEELWVERRRQVLQRCEDALGGPDDDVNAVDVFRHYYDCVCHLRTGGLAEYRRRLVQLAAFTVFDIEAIDAAGRESGLDKKAVSVPNNDFI